MRSRSHHRRLAVAAALLAVAPFAVAVGGQASADDKPAHPSLAEELKASILARGQAANRTLAAQAQAAALPPGGAGNGIFQVYVDQSSGPDSGTFTVLTGPNHPAGPGKNVLFGNGIPGTSYLIVRQIEPAEGSTPERITDWVQGQLITHDTERQFNQVFTNELGTTGFSTRHYSGYTWYVDQKVEVHGTTLADSSVEVTTSIVTDPESAGDTFQLQYIWDVATDQDDGPVLQPQAAGGVFRPFDSTLSTEQTIATTVDSLAVADNDGNPVPPTLGIGVSGSGPSWLQAAPTAPVSQKYVCWPNAVYAPFGEYEVDGTYDVATPASSCLNSNERNDSAIVSQWNFQPGDPADPPTHQASASLFSSPRTPYATAMTATPVLLQAPVFSATVTDTAHNRRLAGRTVSFKVGSTVRCSAVTDANGVARCGTLADRLAAILGLGYTASYQGNAIWAPASARGRLL